jgi:phosphoglycerate kinase
MNKKTVKDVDLKGKRVMMRVDFNVPMKDGAVTDDKRIKASLPTIQYVLEQGASLVLMSHLGRPKGAGFEPEFSLKPASEVLAKLLGKPVQMAPDCVGPEVEAMAKALKPGEVLLLENVRFHKEEEKNDPEFAKQLAKLGDVYVCDAFGSAHRAHASVEGIAHQVPVAVAGFLMEQELEYLGRATSNPEHPYVAILGGAKISDKILVVENLLKQCDQLIIGGGMANTFLAAKGYDMADSLVEAGSIETAKGLLAKSGDKLLLPVDAVIADKFDAEANSQVVDVDKVPAGWRIMDVGPKSLEKFGEVLKAAKLVVWNGPVGVFEMPKFAEGTFAIAKLLATCNATTVIGGGDSASAVKKAGVAKQMTHVSTGGGASLEFLEGKELPGVAALNDK